MKEDVKKEYVSMYVPVELKKEIESARDNDALTETIIKRYIRTETEWLEEELRGIDEYTIKYKAKLIGIKNAFQKAQGSYVDEVGSIYTIADETVNKVSKLSAKLENQTKRAYAELNNLKKSIEYINVNSLERMLEAVNKYNNMTKEEKELITLLLNK